MRLGLEKKWLIRWSQSTHSSLSIKGLVLKKSVKPSYSNRHKALLSKARPRTPDAAKRGRGGRAPGQTEAVVQSD